MQLLQDLSFANYFSKQVGRRKLGKFTVQANIKKWLIGAYQFGIFLFSIKFA